MAFPPGSMYCYRFWLLTTAGAKVVCKMQANMAGNVCSCRRGDAYRVVGVVPALSKADC